VVSNGSCHRQVAACYPRWVLGFAAEVSSLLEEQAAVLDSQLRLALVRALILMRNKGALSALDILPTLFRLFRCHDKVLKQLLFRHIIAGTPLSTVVFHLLHPRDKMS
jgi:protein SDA1